MFRLLRFIVFFLIGYKLLKLLFNASKADKQSSASNQTPNENLHNQSGQQPYSNDKFDDAELIDYEEVK